MEIIARLGTLLGLSFISGVNLYATVAVVGICTKYGLVSGLPPELNVLGHDAVIFVALLLYVMEFLVDKVPWLDTLWDSIHTLIRPLGGAMLALIQAGEASPGMEVIAFMVGASLASAAHMTKAGTRLIVNTSPEPFSNIFISLAEDVGAVGFSYLSLAHPNIAFFLVLVCLILIGYFLPVILRSTRMLFSAVFFKLKSLMQKEAAWTASRSLPFSFDMFFDQSRDADEKFIWTGRAFAIKVPGLPKYAPLQVTITSKAVRCIYRRWFRMHERVLPLGAVQHHKCYTGTILCRWLLKTAKEDWLVYLYQPLSKTLPQHVQLEANIDGKIS